jgi:hypothetical protein
VSITKRQIAGVLGLIAIIVFWFAIGGVLSALVVVLVIVLAVVILNRARRRSVTPEAPAQNP